ncbi:hypothetical protein DCCM_0064 [Desulfocucumis palustris]|uniref:Uncharacterized protein n=1 Tax=Desulfocucumis palustris TaxID=1898651 RepID=A0A2L2X7B1_9FIRM|nr:hypothetical protein DCCM_0064 [Desulfocucumis palustris]
MNRQRRLKRVPGEPVEVLFFQNHPSLDLLAGGSRLGGKRKGDVI